MTQQPLFLDCLAICAITSHIPHLRSQFKSYLHSQYLCHILKALFFYQSSPKILFLQKLFLQKTCKFFERFGRRPQTPMSLAAGGFAPSLDSIVVCFQLVQYCSCSLLP